MTQLVPTLPRTQLPGWMRLLGEDTVPAATRLVERCGSPARVAALGADIVLVSRAEDVEHVFFTGQDNWPKGEEYDIPALGLRNGLVTSRGERWRRDRTMLNPLFSKRNLAPLAGVMAASAAAHGQRWHDGDRVDVVSEMSRLALDIATRTLFGREIADHEFEVVAEGLDETMREMVAVGSSPLIWALSGIPGPASRLAARRHWRTRRIERRLDALDAIVQRIVDDRRSDPDAPTTDFLAQLLAARDPATGAPLTPTEILEQSATFLLAGHETTATGLAWTWHLLAENPDARARLQAELADVLGDRAPAPADIERLPYTRAVFSEALRLRPPVYLSMRRAQRDDVLSGYRVRKGTIALIFSHLVHRDPEHWPDPERFDPGRFMEHHERPRGSYIPFGGGRRVCIGTQFALMEATLIIATLGQRFQLESVPDWTVREEGTTTLRPRGGLPMRVRVRR